MDTNKILNASLDDIVFENRNKTYGAYFLRKIYPSHIQRAALIIFGFTVVLAFTPYIINLINGFKVEPPKKVVKVDYSKLAPPPPIDNTPPPPPPPHVQPPPKVTFTPPVIVQEQVKDEDQPPPQEVLEKKPQGPASTDDGSSVVVAPPEAGTGPAVVETKPQIFSFVEQMPEFPGGDEALKKYLMANITYPQLAREQNIEGTVYLQFVVDANGNIGDIKVLRDVAGGCTSEAVRVVKGMPKWKAGKQNGQAVPVYYNLPVVFQLSGGN